MHKDKITPMRFEPKKILLIVIFTGLFLRLYGINFGLPYQFHQDEPIIVNHALAYGTGDFDPHFFIIPPLTSYILFFFYGVYYLLMNMSGSVKSVEDFALSFFKDPTPFYIIGRVAIGLLPSVLNIFLTYRLATKFFSKKTAIYSSLVMAVAFLNVANAHYIYADNLLVLFTLLSYLSIMKMANNPKMPNYALSAILIGVATAIKYNAILLLTPFLIAHIEAYKKGLLRAAFDAKLWISICLIAAFFIICNPYSIIDYKFFLLSVTNRICHEYIGWTHHIKYSLFQGIGSLSTIAGFIGLYAAFKNNKKKALLLISFPAVFYLHLVFKSQPFSRYVLVLVPFLSLGMGYLFYEYLYIKFKSFLTRSFIAAISILIILPTTAKSISADILFAREDTRIIALKWIEKNIPPLTKIALDTAFLSPPIKQTVNQLKEKESIINRQPELKELKSTKLGLQIKALQPDKSYETYYIVQGNEDAGKFLGFWPVIKSDLGILQQSGMEYLVINNMSISGRIQKDVSSGYIPIAQFSPYKNAGFRRPYDEIDSTGIPIESKELYSRQRSGPYIIIYKIK